MGKGAEVWEILPRTFLEKSAPMVIIYSRDCRSCSLRIARFRKISQDITNYGDVVKDLQIFIIICKHC
jgi:hypothetical protein